MDTMTPALPQVGSCVCRTLPDSFSQKHNRAQEEQGVGVVAPDTAEQELVGEQAGSAPAHTASYSPQAAGEKHQATLSKFPSGR